MALSDGILALFPPHRVPPEIPLRALKYAPNITLSFVALNEDATDGNYVRGWDIENAITSERVSPKGAASKLKPHRRLSTSS